MIQYNGFATVLSYAMILLLLVFVIIVAPAFGTGFVVKQ